jgi:hypothetical protein
MIAPLRMRAAGLSLALGTLWVPGPRVAPGQAPACESAEPTAASCPGGACDPTCVDVGRYDVTDAVVDDTRNGHRLWQRRVSVSLPWEEAVQYCAALTLDGTGGWRLPTPLELEAIRLHPGGLFGGGSKAHYCIPCVDQAAFPDTPAALFWTSRRMPDDTAWYVGFDDGRSHRDTRTDALWVRCTRDPPDPAAGVSP